MLVVRTSGGYPAERRFVLDAVLTGWLGLSYVLETEDRSDVAIQRRDDPSGRTVTLPDTLFQTAPDDWLTERSMPATPLRRMQTRAGAASPAGALPVLFGESWSETGPWRTDGDDIAFGIDVFGSAFFLLSRYEEVVRRVTDLHERFPAAASLAAAEGFLDRPIVDEYVDLLWEGLQSAWADLVRPTATFRLRLTHDVDHPFATQRVGARAVARTAGGDALRRGDPGLAARRIRSYLDARRGRVDRDPFNVFDRLMDASERHGLQATFFVLAGDLRGPWDDPYRLTDPPVRALLQEIHRRGHEIGLHATYDTYRSPEATRAEFSALLEACADLGIDRAPRSVRQHYLRFEAPETWRNHDAAGIDLDYTLGFAEHIGFRSGTCREHPVFDLLDHRQLRVRERPLTVMDVTLFGYMGLDFEAAAARTLALVEVCRRHGGESVLLFHNSTLTSGRDVARYGELVDDIVAGSTV